MYNNDSFEIENYCFFLSKLDAAYEDSNSFVFVSSGITWLEFPALDSNYVCMHDIILTVR